MSEPQENNEPQYNAQDDELWRPCPECGAMHSYTAPADCPTCHGCGGDPADDE